MHEVYYFFLFGTITILFDFEKDFLHDQPSSEKSWVLFDCSVLNFS